MPSSRLPHVPQPVFTTQHDSERVFVVTGRHYIGFIFFILIIVVQLILPLIIFFVGINYFLPALLALDVYVRDAAILLAAVYYLTLLAVFLTSWVIFYYNILVVTDERIIEISQRGIFHREENELTFDQIEDVSCRVKGFLTTVFDVGTLELQSAGATRIFEVKFIPKPRLVAEIIHDLANQAKNQIAVSKRFPNSDVVGIIGGQTVTRNGKKPAIMNLGGHLHEAIKKHQAEKPEPQTLREELDAWWWDQRNRIVGTLTRGRNGRLRWVGKGNNGQKRG